MFSAPATAAPEQPALFAAPGTAPATQPVTRFTAVGRRQAPAGPPPTPEQTAIIDGYMRGEHLTVEALAGTGKTTSLRLLAGERPTRPGAYIAYNKAIADDATGKFPARVITGTAHSFAFQAIGRQYAHRLPSRHGQRSSSQRLPAFQVARILGLRDVRLGDRHITDTALARLAEATVNEFCKTADLEISAKHVPYTPGVELPDQVAYLAGLVVPAAELMWADICNPGGRLWFTHSHYLKMWQLSGPILPVDYVMFDEAQDANPCIAAIITAQEDAQLIYVGDRNQAIMGWNGAIDAMAGFTGGVRLPLTKSFRFGTPIADVANGWLDMLGSQLRVTGHDPIASSLGYLDSPRAILCRTNGGAIGAVLDAQAAGRKVALVGDGTEVKKFAFAARSLMAGKGCDLPELAAFKTWRSLVEYVEEEESGKDLAVLVKLVQRYSPGILIDAVKALMPAKRAELIVSTAHKAKGLEWSTVRIGSDFAPPLEGEKPDRSELMLAYVAVTRAQQHLDRGSLYWPTTGFLDAAGRWRAPDNDRPDYDDMEDL